jgi:hypothetical protein
MTDLEKANRAFYEKSGKALRHLFESAKIPCSVRVSSVAKKTFRRLNFFFPRAFRG